ncbi:MAG: hypothetical protein IPI90_15735 [Saprospiraceae bacterium]|nr:hypothetical protein [Candidatus Vicinibacter affinis]
MAILDEAIRPAAELSHRYIQTGCWPDKAIDLIDEAVPSFVLKLDRVPEEA